MGYWQTCRNRRGRLEGEGEGGTREDMEEKVCVCVPVSSCLWVEGQKLEVRGHLCPDRL